MRTKRNSWAQEQYKTRVMRHIQASMPQYHVYRGDPAIDLLAAAYQTLRENNDKTTG